MEGIKNNLKSVWDRLFSILSSAKNKGINIQACCRTLSELPQEERQQYLQSIWGRPAVEKCNFLLERIAIIENELNRKTPT